MYKIRLNDGTEFDVRWCGESGGILTCDIKTEKTFLEVAQVFDDAEKTAKIVFVYGGMQDEFLGFTDLAVINGSTDGEYLISLRKG